MRRLAILWEHNECTLTCLLNFDWYLTETELLLLSEPTAWVSWALWFLTFADIVFMEQTSSVFDVNPCNTLICLDCGERGQKMNGAMAAVCQRINVSLMQWIINRPGLYLDIHTLDADFIIIRWKQMFQHALLSCFFFPSFLLKKTGFYSAARAQLDAAAVGNLMLVLVHNGLH